MKKNYKPIASLLFIALFVSLIPLYGEDKKEDYTPEPYTYDEFPLWQHELRRFEILSFGALPFVTLLSFWGYDMIRYFKNNRDTAYAPWPFKSTQNAVPLTSKEMRNVFFVALGISVTIAIIDVSYRAIKRSITLKRLERENLVQEQAIQFEEISDDQQSSDPQEQAQKAENPNDGDTALPSEQDTTSDDGSTEPPTKDD